VAPGPDPMYNFKMCNHNASALCSRLQRFLKVEQNIFVFKTHLATLSV
jgi:hypothetical protein